MPTWETATDWDNNQSDGNYQSGAGVVRHEASQTGYETGGDSVLEKGPPSTVLPGKAPLGHWPQHEDTAGTCNDASGTLDMDSVTGTTASASGGPLNYGYRSYDGSDDVARTSSTVTFSSHTFGTWVNLRATTPDNFEGFVTTDGDDGGGYSQSVTYDSSSGTSKGFRVQIEDGNGNEKRYTSASDIDDGNWHLIGFSYNDAGDSLSIYLDGVEDTGSQNVDDTLTFSVTLPIQLGLTRGDFRHLNGDLAYSFVDDTAWSAADWASLYQTFI